MRSQLGLRRDCRYLIISFLVLACGGDFFADCEGCTIEPIAEGFPENYRIPRAAQVRISGQGLDYLADQIDALVPLLFPDGLEFDIPNVVAFVSSTRAEACPDNDCTATVSVSGFDIRTPSSIDGGRPLQSNQIELGLFVELTTELPINLQGFSCNADCAVEIDTTRNDRDYIRIDAIVTLEEINRSPRRGFTQVVIEGDSIQINAAGGFETADISFNSCSGSCSSILNSLRDTIESAIYNVFTTQVEEILPSALEELFCTLRGETGCPPGTHAIPDESPESTCRYLNSPASDCVPPLLGVEGQGDFGSLLLGGFASGVHAPLKFIVAVGGDAMTLNDGITLELDSGFLSTDRTYTSHPGRSTCVPAKPPPYLPWVPSAQFLSRNFHPYTGVTHHIGLGLSEQFLNYIGWSLFDSGFLCLAAGTPLSQLLTTGLVSALTPSLSKVTFPESNNPLSVAVRPQEPLVFEVGRGDETDPLLNVILNDLILDFYVWSKERYVRFMTYKTDIEVPLDLVSGPGGIELAILELRVGNSVVSNTTLIDESPDSIAGLVDTVLLSFYTEIVGELAPIAVPSVLGFDLEIPMSGGFAGVSDGGDEFLAIYLDVALAETQALRSPLETEIELQELSIDPMALRMDTWGQGGPPEAKVRLSAKLPNTSEPNASLPVEYRVRIDGLPWSDWSPSNEVVLRDPALLLQAKHLVEAQARIAGEPSTADQTPAQAELIIDILPPEVRLVENSEGIHVEANDIVSNSQELSVRWRPNLKSAGDEEHWTPWRPLAEANEPPLSLGSTVEVQVRDESGNVGVARSSLIRGANLSTAGCECSIATNPGMDAGPGGGLVGVRSWFSTLLFSLLGFWLHRTRRSIRGAIPTRATPTEVHHLAVPRRKTIKAAKPGRQDGSATKSISTAGLIVGVGLIFGVGLGGLGLAGCGEGLSGGASDAGTDAEQAPAPVQLCGNRECILSSPRGEVCCQSMEMCVEYNVNDFCEAGFQCANVNYLVANDDCQVLCTSCIPSPALQEGQLATYLDSVLLDDGNLVLSGYSPGAPGGGRYGDLVVGVWNASNYRADWQIIDGAPGEPIEADPSGWRGGVRAEGNDVGRFSSIVAAESNLGVAYYDRTHTALKFAARIGDNWNIQTVTDTGDSGAYAELLLTATGEAIIAFHVVEPPSQLPGRPVSYTRVATGSSGLSSTEWSFEDVHSAAFDCRPRYCESGTCVASGVCANETTDCSEPCEEGSLCVAGTCEVALPDPYIEDLPQATGLYNAMAPVNVGTVALVFYDRSTGDLRGASRNSAGWSAPFLIDGIERNDPFVGDSGLSASLTVDPSGTWHVSWVDGGEESLRYTTVRNGVVDPPQTVDEGSTTPEGVRHFDGRHIVGDSSSIAVTLSGEVRITYQDATAGRTMLARLPPNGQNWLIEILDGAGHTGYWTSQIVWRNTSVISYFWRGLTPNLESSGVRVINYN